MTGDKDRLSAALIAATAPMLGRLIGRVVDRGKTCIDAEGTEVGGEKVIVLLCVGEMACEDMAAYLSSDSHRALTQRVEIDGKETIRFYPERDQG